MLHSRSQEVPQLQGRPQTTCALSYKASNQTKRQFTRRAPRQRDVSSPKPSYRIAFSETQGALCKFWLGDRPPCPVPTLFRRPCHIARWLYVCTVIGKGLGFTGVLAPTAVSFRTRFTMFVVGSRPGRSEKSPSRGRGGSERREDIPSRC